MIPGPAVESFDRADRLIMRGASLLTVLFLILLVWFSLTDLPFDRQARAWIRAAEQPAQERPSALARLASMTPVTARTDLNALSCWYLPYTPHERLVAQLKTGGVTTPCAAARDVAQMLAKDAQILSVYETLAEDAALSLPVETQNGPDAGAVLSTAIALDLARIAVLAAKGDEMRDEALVQLAGRLAMLRRIVVSPLPISVRAAALQGMVYILRFVPVAVGDDAVAGQRFKTAAGAALATLSVESAAVEEAMRLRVAMRLRSHDLEDAGQATLANDVLVLKPTLYARLSMDMTRAVLSDYVPDRPAESLNALRMRVDGPIRAMGVRGWLHPVQTAAMIPFLQHDGGVLLGFLIDLIQFNELRRMLDVNLRILEEVPPPAAIADFLAAQDAALFSTLTGRPFAVDAHGGDLVTTPAEDDTLAYTIRLYMGRGGGGMPAERIWPPESVEMQGDSKAATP